MPQSTEKSDFSDQRRSERVEVFLRTNLTVGKKSGISAQLVNISTHGFMVRTAETVAEGTNIKILLPSAGNVGAKAVWGLGGRIGCSFDIPLDETDFTRTLDAIKTAKPNWQSTSVHT